jgi:hypothetical protein
VAGDQKKGINGGPAASTAFGADRAKPDLGTYSAKDMADEPINFFPTLHDRPQWRFFAFPCLECFFLSVYLFFDSAFLSRGQRQGAPPRASRGCQATCPIAHRHERARRIRLCFRYYYHYYHYYFFISRRVFLVDKGRPRETAEHKASSTA